MASAGAPASAARRVACDSSARPTPRPMLEGETQKCSSLQFGDEGTSMKKPTTLPPTSATYVGQDETALGETVRSSRQAASWEEEYVQCALDSRAIDERLGASLSCARRICMSKLTRNGAVMRPIVF